MDRKINIPRHSREFQKHKNKNPGVWPGFFQIKNERSFSLALFGEWALQSKKHYLAADVFSPALFGERAKPNKIRPIPFKPSSHTKPLAAPYLSIQPPTP